MNKKDNCFAFLKLIIALSGVYQHARLFGLNLPDIKAINWIDKVPLFFFISAYTIMMSLTNRKQSWKEYGFRRFLRIYPELWLSVLFDVIVLLAQFPYLIKQLQFHLWIFCQSTIFQFWTPDILRFYGNGTPNGSLWTIFITIQFYVLIYLTYEKIEKLNWKQDIAVLVLCVFGNSFISFFDERINTIIFHLMLQTIVPYLYMFYFGIIFYKYSDKLIDLCKKYFWPIVLLFIASSIWNKYINFIPHTYTTGTVLHVLMCCVLFFAFAYKYNFIKIKKDYSYGIYIYHMIILNLFVHNALLDSSYVSLGAIYLITIIAAVISNYIAGTIIRKLKAA